MFVNILNDTAFSSIKVVCDGKEFFLKRGGSAKTEIADNKTRLDVFVCDKSRVYINILFAAIDGVLTTDHVTNEINCSASFELYISCDNTTVVLSKLLARKKENDYIYQSVYPSGSFVFVDSASYSKTDTKKQEKKCKFYYGFITSWILLDVVLLILGLCFTEISMIGLSILGILFVGIPSWKKAARVKKFYSNESANKYLHERIAEINRLGSPDAVDPPDDFGGRKVYKGFDKIFGKKKN